MTTTTHAAPPGGISPVEPSTDRGTLARLLTDLAPRYATLAFFVVMFAFFAQQNGERFFGAENITTILGQSAILGIVACGLTVPLIVNAFDLSVGWHASFAGVLGATLASSEGTGTAIAATLVVGAVVGGAIGVVVTRLRVSSLIATLAAGAILVGLAQRVNNTIVAVPDSYGWLGQHEFGAIPFGAVLMIAIAIVLWVVTNHTPFGRSMYAIGSNREASRLAGINIRRVTVIALTVSGVTAALGGLMLSSTVEAGQPGAGDSLLLDGFTAAAIGTVTFRRGEYNIAGTVFAVILLATMLNGMTQMGWAPYWQNILKGVVLIAAVAASVGSSEDR